MTVSWTHLQIDQRKEQIARTVISGFRNPMSCVIHQSQTSQQPATEKVCHRRAANWTETCRERNEGGRWIEKESSRRNHNQCLQFEWMNAPQRDRTLGDHWLEWWNVGLRKHEWVQHEDQMSIFNMQLKMVSAVAHLCLQNKKDILQLFHPFPADRWLSSLLRYENLTMVAMQDTSLCLHNAPRHQGVWFHDCQEGKKICFFMSS